MDTQQTSTSIPHAISLHDTEIATTGQIEVPIIATTMAADQTATTMAVVQTATAMAVDQMATAMAVDQIATAMAVDQTMMMSAANQTATATMTVVAVDQAMTIPAANQMDNLKRATVATVDQTPPMTTTDQTVTMTAANQTATATITDQTAPITTADQITTVMSTSSDNPASFPDQSAYIYSNTTIAGTPDAPLIEDSRDGVQTASLRVLSNPMVPLVLPIQTFENLTTNFAASSRTVELTTTGMVSANPPTSVGPPNVGTGKKKAGIMRPNPLSTTAR